MENSLITQASLQPKATGNPSAKPSLPGPRLGLWPAHATGALPSMRTAQRSMAWPRLAHPPWRAHRPTNDGGNIELFEGKWLPGDGLHGSPSRQSAQQSKMTSTGKSVQKWKKVLLDWLPSWTRAPWMLGTAWPVMRCIGAAAHWRSVKAIGKIRCRGWRGGARAAKISAKALWARGDSLGGRKWRGVS
jgi:hypothetical protein